MNRQPLNNGLFVDVEEASCSRTGGRFDLGIVDVSQAWLTHPLAFFLSRPFSRFQQRVPRRDEPQLRGNPSQHHAPQPCDNRHSCTIDWNLKHIHRSRAFSSQATVVTAAMQYWSRAIWFFFCSFFCASRDFTLMHLYQAAVERFRQSKIFLTFPSCDQSCFTNAILYKAQNAGIMHLS